MNLLNRYLQEVAKYLPRSRRSDIVEELRANILSQMEDREEELGRALTDNELVRMLQHHGNPMFIAGRYREDNLGLAFGIQLIGPELFPFYKTILLLNLSVTVTIAAVLLPILARANGGAITVTRVLTPLVLQFMAVTLIFVLLDRGKDHWLNRWDPGKLPPLKTEPEDGPTALNIFSLIALAVGTLWLALTPRWPYLMLGPGALFLPALALRPMPSWPMFYWVIVAALCARLGLEFFRLFRWLPRQRAHVADVMLRGISVIIGVLLLLKAPNYVTSPNSEVAHWANLNFEIAVIVAVAINLWGTGRTLLSLLRERDQMLPARQY
jgi:hypothetical protein